MDAESSIEQFICAENGNIERAAIRLANYWKARKQVFKDRWLLPLTQTGGGALSAEDIALLRSGYLVIVCRPSGGTVALIDESLEILRLVFCSTWSRSIVS